MTFGKFIKRVFGKDEAAAMPDAPFAQTAPRAMPASAAPVREHPLLVRRDEMLDARSRIAGYRFVTHYAGSQMRPEPKASVAALYADHLPSFAARRLALVPISAQDWFSADFGPLAAPHTVYLLGSPPAGADLTRWREALAALKAAGVRIALDSAAAADAQALALAELLVLDFSAYALPNFERLVRALAVSHPALALAADGVASWPEHRLCLSLGIRYCMGGFAAGADAEEHGEKFNQSRLVLIDMLNLMRREAELADLATVAKRDPWVAVKVVSMANSPMAGLASPVASLEQAMMVLGRAMLYRWLSISLFKAGSDSGRDEALLELALYRARLLELLAGALRPRQECDELFLVGLLSLLDSLLGLPMARIVAKMNLPDAVAAVLLKSEGPYAPFLMLALAAAGGRAEQAQRIGATLGIDAARLGQCAGAARAWTEEVLRQS